MKMKSLVATMCLTVSGLASAAVIPSGIQTNVSNAQIASWGWTECSRSSTVSGTWSTAAVLSSCKGDYLAMGAWDASTGAYGVVGMGDRSVVSAILYMDFHGDNNGTVQNWSNGLNWYRTSGPGSWGFTTSAATALNSADINLLDGLSNFDEYGSTETTLAAGMSLHLDGNGDFHNGWGYNPDGNHFTYMYDSGDERVFWVANKTNGSVPEPATLGLLGLGIAGLAAVRRRRQQR